MFATAVGIVCLLLGLAAVFEFIHNRKTKLSETTPNLKTPEKNTTTDTPERISLPTDFEFECSAQEQNTPEKNTFTQDDSTSRQNSQTTKHPNL